MKPTNYPTALDRAPLAIYIDQKHEPIMYVWPDENLYPVLSRNPQPEHLWRGGQGQTRPSGWHPVGKGPA